MLSAAVCPSIRTEDEISRGFHAALRAAGEVQGEGLEEQRSSCVLLLVHQGGAPGSWRCRFSGPVRIFVFEAYMSPLKGHEFPNLSGRCKSERQPRQAAVLPKIPPEIALISWCGAA